MADTYPSETIDRVVAGLEEGRSLVLICQDEGMPNRSTVYRWMDGSDELAERLFRAREVGFHYRAEKAVAAAKAATDPIAGRLAFDAERWYLGKLSNAFRDKPAQIGVAVNVDSGDTYAAIAGVLDQAAAAIAGGSHSTHTVALPSPTGPGHPAGGMADLAGAGGPRLGQDQDRR